MNIVDLTHTLTADIPVYPGDPPVKLEHTFHLENDGYNEHTIQCGMHVGTHMDSPLHMIEDGTYLSDIPIERFFGKGHLIDARGQKEISDDLLEDVSIEKGDIVLMMTDFSAYFQDPKYFEEFPEITEDFAKRAVDLGVSIVGMDTPSPDRPPHPVHKILLGNDVLIIENLTNLEELIGKTFTVAALPAKFRTDGAPVRVVAMIE